MSFSVYASNTISDVSLNFPVFLAVDASNNLYCANNNNNNILKFSSSDPSGTIFYDLSSSPFGLAINEEGYLFVSQEGSGNIIKINSDGSSSSLFASSLSFPRGLTFDTSGNLYCAIGVNSSASSIIKFDASSNNQSIYADNSITTITDGSNVIPNAIIIPNGLAFDTSGNLYVTQGSPLGDNIIKIYPGGLAGTVFLKGLANPHQIAFDLSGNLYCADTIPSRIIKIYSDSTYSVVVNDPSGSYPYGLAFDLSENLYYSERTTNTIYKSDEPICFNHDTKILCLNSLLQEEYIPIQDLKKGDFVKTYLHGFRRIDYIYQSFMRNNPNQWNHCMYKMEKTEENGLLEDLIVTGGHAIMVDGISEVEQERYNKLGLNNFVEENKIDDKFLVLAAVSDKFIQLTDNNKYTYYHLLIENDGDDTARYGVWANGILTETPSKSYLVEQKNLNE